MRFPYHSGDPFSSMNGTMPHYALLRALAAATIDVDPLDVATLKGRASRYDLGIVGICSCKITDPLLVVCDRVVRVEPRAVWSEPG
jgi:hypothetical protein